MFCQLLNSNGNIRLMGGQKGVRKAKRGWGGERTEQVAVRLSESLLRRVDRHVERLTAQTPLGISVTRADAMRVLLHEALEAAETSGKYTTPWQE